MLPIQLFLLTAAAPQKLEKTAAWAGRWLGQAQSDFRLGRSEGGKPYFLAPGAPQFSLSHSADIWACAFADQPLGLDIELNSRQTAKATEIARRVFHAEEQAYLATVGETAFLPLWTAKEAYVKYLGLGIAAHFPRFSVVAGQSLRCEIDGLRLSPLPLPGLTAHLCHRQAAPILVYDWRDA